jgi:hypothetical protein
MMMLQLLLGRGPEDPVGGKSDSSVGEAQVGTENEEEEEEEGHATQLSGMESPSSIVLTSLIAGYCFLSVFPPFTP